jgi:hypothetical protein
MLQNSNLRKELLVNRFDLHPSQLAAMTHGPMVSLAPLILESDHLFVFELFNHFTDHLCPGNNWITGCDGRSVSEQNDISESHLLSIGGCEFVNRYGLPGAHPILLTSRTNNRVRHVQCPIGKTQKVPYPMPPDKWFFSHTCPKRASDSEVKNPRSQEFKKIDRSSRVPHHTILEFLASRILDFFY